MNAFTHGGDARRYLPPILMPHEIAKDVVAVVSATVTYCTLFNTTIVFDWTLGKRTLKFWTNGKLRDSGLMMYNRQTEDWWQQFAGEATIGELTSRKLRILPRRSESTTTFGMRYPDIRISLRPVYNPDLYVVPYVRYDLASQT